MSDLRQAMEREARVAPRHVPNLTFGEARFRQGAEWMAGEAIRLGEVRQAEAKESLRCCGPDDGTAAYHQGQIEAYGEIARLLEGALKP